jgi:hypothetical protein
MRKPATDVLGDGFSTLRKEEMNLKKFSHLAIKPVKKIKRLV